MAGFNAAVNPAIDSRLELAKMQAETNMRAAAAERLAEQGYRQAVQRDAAQSASNLALTTLREQGDSERARLAREQQLTINRDDNDAAKARQVASDDAALERTKASLRAQFERMDKADFNRGRAAIVAAGGRREKLPGETDEDYWINASTEVAKASIPRIEAAEAAITAKRKEAADAAREFDTLIATAPAEAGREALLLSLSTAKDGDKQVAAAYDKVLRNPLLDPVVLVSGLPGASDYVAAYNAGKEKVPEAAKIKARSLEARKASLQEEVTKLEAQHQRFLSTQFGSQAEALRYSQKQQPEAGAEQLMSPPERDMGAGFGFKLDAGMSAAPELPALPATVAPVAPAQNPFQLPTFGPPNPQQAFMDTRQLLQAAASGQRPPELEGINYSMMSGFPSPADLDRALYQNAAAELALPPTPVTLREGAQPIPGASWAPWRSVARDPSLMNGMTDDAANRAAMMAMNSIRRPRPMAPALAPPAPAYVPPDYRFTEIGLPRPRVSNAVLPPYATNQFLLPQ